MRIILVVPLCLPFAYLTSGAQIAPAEDQFAVQIERMQINGTLVPPQISEPEKPLSLQSPQEDIANQLPDMPKPKQDKRGADDGYVYYETRVWWRDVNEPVPAWWHGLRSPKFLVGVGLLGGLTVLQLNETIKCKPTCSNFFGSNRVAAYAINIPASSAIVWASARSMERNKPKPSRAKLMMFVAIWLEAMADL